MGRNALGNIFKHIKNINLCSAIKRAFNTMSWQTEEMVHLCFVCKKYCAQQPDPHETTFTLLLMRTNSLLKGAHYMWRFLIVVDRRY
jgi:hypothetical protein